MSEALPTGDPYPLLPVGSEGVFVCWLKADKFPENDWSVAFSCWRVVSLLARLSAPTQCNRPRWPRPGA
jgi:hypothetical protein